MGYLQEKYTKSYYLKVDDHGNPTKFGVEGIENFKKGNIRVPDEKILSRLVFGNKTVLDIGFGRGEAIKYAFDNGARKVIGVDFSQDAFDIAQESLRKHNLPAELYCEDVLDFFKRQSLKNVQFDFVFLLDVVEHIPRSELREIMLLLRGMLTPKSIVCVNTPVFDVDNDVIKDGLKSQARDTGDAFEETSGMHCNRYTKKTLRDFMKSCGFSAISGHYYLPQTAFTNFYLPNTPIMWGLAWIFRYPVKYSSIFQKEMYEYANPKKVRSFKESMTQMTKQILPPFLVTFLKKIINNRF